MQYVVCSVRWSVCAVFNMHSVWNLPSFYVQWAMCSVQCAVCSVQCAVCSVQCAFWWVQCAVFTIHSTFGSALYFIHTVHCVCSLYHTSCTMFMQCILLRLYNCMPCMLDLNTEHANINSYIMYFLHVVYNIWGPVWMSYRRSIAWR